MSTEVLEFDEDLLATVPAFYGPGRMERYKRLRDTAPVSFHPEVVSPFRPDGGRGWWAVTRYEDVKAVIRTPALYSSAEGTNPNDEPEFVVRALGMLHMDDPEHRLWRSIVGPSFAPRYLDAMMDDLKVLSNQVIDRLLSEPNVDIVKNLVNYYPIRVICNIMGMPEEDVDKFVEWTRLAFSPNRELGEPAHKALIDYGVKLSEARRANPQDDLITRIVESEVDGRKLTDQEVGGFISLLVGAGAETSGATMAYGIARFAENPDQWKKLQDDPSLVGGAVDEMLRHASAVVNFRRNATEDVELGGQLIKKGDKVVVFFESANNDETVFPNPEKFDITRDATGQTAFGAGGPHQCLGEHLARREMKVFFTQLLERVSSWEITEGIQLIPSPRFNMVINLKGTFHAK